MRIVYGANKKMDLVILFFCRKATPIKYLTQRIRTSRKSSISKYKN